MLTKENEDRDDGRSVRAASQRTERRKELLTVALSVFSARGYHQTRISDIIEAAGVARGTFYLYFESKHAIFEALLDEVLRRIRESVRGVDLGPAALPLRDQLRGILVNLLSLVHESPELSRLVLREAIGIDHEIDRKLHGFYGELHRWLTQSLANGQALGFLARFDAPLVAWCILGSVERVLRLLLERKDAFSLEAMAEALLDSHLTGILAR